MFSAPLSPTLSIQLDTPPISPGTQVASVASPSPEPYVLDLEPTPTKKRKEFDGPITTNNLKRTKYTNPLDLGTLPISTPVSHLPLVAGVAKNPQKPDLKDDAYQAYVDLVASDCVSFYQLSETVFVVQGWDGNMRSGTVCSNFLVHNFYLICLTTFQRSWYHLQCKVIGEDVVVVCFCSSSLKCVHKRFIEEYGDEQFPSDDVLNHGKFSFSSLFLLSSDPET
jgi:hypothetical protein